MGEMCLSLMFQHRTKLFFSALSTSLARNPSVHHARARKPPPRGISFQTEASRSSGRPPHCIRVHLDPFLLSYPMPSSLVAVLATERQLPIAGYPVNELRPP